MDVECVFSHGWLILFYVRNCLSAQSTRAQLCAGNWSLCNHIHDSDVLAALLLPDIHRDDEEEFEINSPIEYL